VPLASSSMLSESDPERSSACLASPMTKVAGSAMSTGSTVPSETTCYAHTVKLGLPVFTDVHIGAGDSEG
jgi:hypothetical protein